MITTLFTDGGLSGLHVDNARALIWFTRDDGLVFSVDLAGDATKHQQLPVRPVDIAGSAKLLVVAGEDGTLWRIDPRRPDRAATRLGTVPKLPAQIAVTGTGATVITVDGVRAAAVSVRSGVTRRYALPRGAAGVAEASGVVAAAVNDPVSGESRLRLTAPLTESDPLAALGRVGFATDGATLYGAQPSGNTLTAWTPSAASVRTESTAALPGTIVEAQGLADGRIAVLTDTTLALLDSLDDLVAVGPRPATITAPAAPLFVASWVPLAYDLGDTGLTPSQIGFVVPDGPDAGIVSHTRQDGDAEPSPILVAGGRLGVYKVVMIETATNTELAYAEFEVSNDYDATDAGPSMMITGRSTEFSGDAGWGGGPAGPQNAGDLTHLGTWNVLVLLVDTSTARWPAANLANDRTTALQHVTNGFDVGGGVLRSARDYYDENSGGQLALAVRNNATFGPVSMPNAWESYFFQPTNSAGVVTDTRWWPTDTNWQQFLTQAINDGDVTTADLRGWTQSSSSRSRPPAPWAATGSPGRSATSASSAGCSAAM